MSYAYHSSIHGPGGAVGHYDVRPGFSHFSSHGGAIPPVPGAFGGFYGAPVYGGAYFGAPLAAPIAAPIAAPATTVVRSAAPVVSSAAPIVSAAPVVGSYGVPAFGVPAPVFGASTFNYHSSIHGPAGAVGHYDVRPGYSHYSSHGGAIPPQPFFF
eukprot:TRINITY_DN173_c0_g1_i1.p3 TRINITY_DN173_c0_g1~~TRINITY_DN173_c0_g1_i1.p3  ORF type:complete len:163 (+),score=34.66 TRINITY_DN173_c0_g1_i1:24-491(+)